MKNKVFILAALALICALLVSCRNQKPDDTYDSTSKSPDSSAFTDTQEQKAHPKSNAELFDLLIESWKNGTAGELYEYASEEMKSLLTQNSFEEMFDRVSAIGGNIVNVQKTGTSEESGIDTYRASVEFEHITANIQLSLQDVNICGFFRDIFFTDTFEITYENSITERYFVLENDGYSLNAVYTYSDKSNKSPSVLLISGSGPCDYDETVGLLTPFADIAKSLAEQGISSLRIDKRTLHYADSFKPTDGIEEEYLKDCRAALTWLKNQENTESVYLLGHSLGGQIAAVLAAEYKDIKGTVIFNSTPRHLADIMYEQLSINDPANISAYSQYTAAAKKATFQESKGAYYYGANDYYWASYNSLDIIGSIKESGSPVLIINSTYDNQLFDEDIEQWDYLFGNDSLVTIKCYDDMSHFGYKIDTKVQSLLYSEVEFPPELIADFATFINQPIM